MKRNGKHWKMPKNLDAWQKDLQMLIGKTVDMDHRLGKQLNTYKNAEVLNVDVRMGNRFKIKQKNGKTRYLIGGTYDILELPEKNDNNVPELIDYGEKAKLKE